MPPSPESPSQWIRTAAAQSGSVLLATARPDAENQASYLFSDPLEILTTDQLDDIPNLFAAIGHALQAGHHVAGFLSYEAGYHFEPAALRPAAHPPAGSLPLAWFGVYAAPRVQHGFSAAFQPRDDTPESAPQIGISRDDYTAAIHRIRQYIAGGDFYQANFTIPLRLPWTSGAARLFERILANQPVPYAALLNLGATHIVSASPELFFRRTGHTILVRPMKGTCPRGRDCAEDARNAAWLAADEKNHAENVMIVDLLRNDLGRICVPGSIRASHLFHVERYPALLQMTSTVRGDLRPGTSAYDIFRALFPCGSITGAPKVRTMQAIRELEHEARGIACGAIGYFAPGGDAVFSVAIRTAALRDGEVHMRVGSGITYDSDADAEFSECLLKAQFLSPTPVPFELIETLRWDGAYFLLDEHLDRLQASAAYFDFAFNRARVHSELREFAKKLPFSSSGFAPRLGAPGLDSETRDSTMPTSSPDTCHRVRLLLARSGSVSITSEPLPPDRRPVRLKLVQERVDPADPFVRHKTTRRAVYDRGLAEARAAGCADALFLNRAGHVTECAIHNLLILRGGEILTPALDCGLLPGVYRRHLLERHANMREATLTLEDLQHAERVYIFNSVRGLRRVERIVGYSVHADPAG
ncbi:MAG: aminodeoxychorismate synthase component I [Acidobacteriota bacterium]